MRRISSDFAGQARHLNKFQSKSRIQTVLKVNLTFRITQNHFAIVLCGIRVCSHKTGKKRNYDKTIEAVIAAELNALFHLSFIAVRVMRVSIAVSEVPEETVKFHL